MPPLRVVVVGAGIGGPAVALGLAQNGHQVTIYERATNTSEVGYAFRIMANSDRCLKHLGIDVVAGGAVSATTAKMMNADGRVIMETKENPDPKKAKEGENVFSFRPQLHQQLTDAALAQGATLREGVKVKAVDTDKSSLTLEDESEVQADLIIAADGARSATRNQVLKRDDRVPYSSTGHSAIRFMLSKAEIQADPIMSAALSDEFRMVTWMNPEKRILVYPVDFDRQLNITCTYPTKALDAASEGGESEAAVAYNERVSLEQVLSIYEEFEPRVAQLFKLADPDGFRVWKLVDMDEIDTWSAGNTVLLGDAAHPVSPFGFSGASMAIEDALVLKMLLPIDTPREEIADRFKLYEEIRKPRVGRVRDTSRRIAQDEDVKSFIMEYRQFLQEYDAVAHAREELHKRPRNAQ